MAIVDLGLQAIAIARTEMPKEMEEEAERCNSLKALLLWYHKIVSVSRSLS